MNPNKESLPSLTVLRYPAAIWVVLLHLHNALSKYMREPFLGDHPILMACVDRGFLGVTFFFVLSGFILAYTYDRRYAERDFYIARAARVLPVYYLSLLASLPFIIYTSVKSDATATLVYGVPVLFLVQSWFPPLCGFWNGPAWTLSCEAFFYSVFPWINRSLSKLAAAGKNPVAKCLGVIAVAAVLGSCLPVLVGTMGADTSQIGFYIRQVQQYPDYLYGGRIFTLNMWAGHLPIFRLFEFIIGVATYRLFRISVENRSWTVGEARWVLVITSFVFFGFLIGTGSLPFVMLLGSLAAPVCAAVIFGAAAYDRVRHAERQEGPVLKAGILLGQSSYAVYLMHSPTIPYLLKVFEKLHLIKSDRVVVSFLVMAVIMCGVVTVLSVAIFLLYEEPGRKMLKARLGRMLPERRTAESYA